MTILEILEAHTLEWVADDVGNYECACGFYPDPFNGTDVSIDDQHRAHFAEVLNKHMQEREAGAVRETSRYLQRIFPRKGLVNRADILADIEIAADRIGRGLHANGREKDQS